MPRINERNPGATRAGLSVPPSYPASVTPQVIRVRTRETICRSEIHQLILRAARKCEFPEPAAVLAEIVRDIACESQGVFVGFDGERPCAAVVCFLPVNAFWLAATCAIAYSDKSPQQFVAVCARAREWFRQHGHENIVVLNLLHTDRSYIRGLAHFGHGDRIGGVIRFSF